VAGWHPSIGKSVLENWEFAEHIAIAVGSQLEYERLERHTVDLTDVLTASVVLAEVYRGAAPFEGMQEGVSAFKLMSITPPDSQKILEQTAGRVQELLSALGF
jgi:HD-like signal output (HDOD) protein